MSLRTEGEVRAAYELAASFRRGDVMVETYIEGDDYRSLVPTPSAEIDCVTAFPWSTPTKSGRAAWFPRRLPGKSGLVAPGSSPARFTGEMASPFVHLAVASDVLSAVELGRDVLPDVLLGSVAPDADKLGACSRETSHFWSFSEDVSGALKLLHAHPELAAACLSPAERAFLAGYLCHLVADEQWMLVIYRPFFGRHSSYRGSQEGVEVQWALHMLLDAQLMAPESPLPALVRLLQGAGIDRYRPDLLPFLPMQSVERFRIQVLRQAAEPAGRARAELIVMGRELATGVPRSADQRAAHDRFIDALPALMDQAAAYVPARALADFDQRARQESGALLRDYLAGRPLQPPRGTAAPTWPAT